MKLKLKNVELLSLYNALKQISDAEQFNKFFTYAAIVTEDNIYGKVMGMIQIAKPSDSYRKYEEQREVLIHKYAECDDNGNMVINNTNKTVKIKTEYLETAKSELNLLIEKYKDVLNDREQDIKDYNEVLDKTVEVDIEQIEFRHLPDTINKLLMRAIKPMLQADTEESEVMGVCAGCS